MMTVTESTANAMSQPIDYNNYAINRSYMTTAYDYRHQNPWEKPNYATFHQQSPLFPTYSTGNISAINNDTISNLNNTNNNFYRRHTESTLPISSSSVYSSTTSNHPSTAPFNYSHHPPGFFFGWNNGSSLMRTHSASYHDYPGSSSYPSYNPMNSSSSQPTTNDKATASSRAQQMASNNTYPPFFNLVPPINFSLPPPSSMPYQSSKRSISSKVSKRPRLTAHLRSEILKLKATKPTVFVWEIQQNLLQNGICTSQTLPNATAIQRVLNETSKPIKEETKPDVNQLMQSLLNSASPVTICLSPSSSNGESVSECSICLESYRSGQEVSILACSHEYHSSCIGEWMLKSRSCPMCRKDIHNQPQFVTLLI